MFYDKLHCPKCKIKTINEKYNLVTIFALVVAMTNRQCAAYPYMSSNIVGDGQSLFNLIGFEANQTYTLLYRASVNGFGASAFHSLCDGAQQTITIIKSTNGYIFGGYANLPWQSTAGTYGNDPDAFLFSLVNYLNTSVLIKTSGPFVIYSLHFYSAYGPSFGANDLTIADQSNTNINSISDLIQSYPYSVRSLLTGGVNFKTTEIEVYQSNTFINGSSKTLTMSSNANSVTSSIPTTSTKTSTTSTPLTTTISSISPTKSSSTSSTSITPVLTSIFSNIP